MKTIEVKDFKFKIKYKESKGLQDKFDSITTIASLFDYDSHTKEDIKTDEFFNFYTISFDNKAHCINIIVTTDKELKIDEISVEHCIGNYSKYRVGFARTKFAKFLKKVEELL